MSNKNLTIDLKATKDKRGQTYYIGKIKAPALLTLSEGVTFLVFISEEGSEQLQVAPMTKKDDFEDMNFNEKY